MALFATKAIDCSDHATIERLYRAMGRAAVSKTEYLVGRRDVAQEIVQEVFLKLWREKLLFESEKQIYFWIYKSCHHAGIDHLRSATYRRETATPESLAEAPQGGLSALEINANRDYLVKALKILDEREAAVLGYSVIDGMTQEEIAALLGLSRKTIVRTQKSLDEKLARLKEHRDG